MDAVKKNVPDITAERALLLQFECEISMELSIVWFISMAWKMIWDARSNGKKPELYKIRSEMEARISLLRTTRSYVNDTIMMETLLASVE